LSACFAQYQDLAWAGFAELMRWGVIYFLVARIVANSWRLRIFLFLLLLLNLKLAQFVIRSYFKEIASGLDPTYLAKVGVGTHSGFFANGSDLGLAMCIVVPLAVSLFFGETKTLWQLFLLASSMFFLGAILVCGSRGAQLGVVAIALAAWARQPTKIAVVAMIVLLGVMGVYLLPEASMERMRSALEWEHDKTASHRIFLWKAGLRMFSEHPIIGVGPWNYGPTRARYYPGLDQRTTGTHNTFLQALTELGVLGSVPFLMLLLFLLRLNARTRKRLLALGTASYRSLEYRLALGLDLALVGFLASGFFHNALYFPHLWLLLGLSVGLHTACTQIQPEELSVLLQDERRTVARAVS
jgi:O-antigen ligase